jgi:DNA-binding CsgD family transcriptional regulator
MLGRDVASREIGVNRHDIAQQLVNVGRPVHESALRTIASRLVGGVSFIEVAIAVCELARDVFSIEDTAMCLHARDGQPLLLVDVMAAWLDEDRTAWFDTGWHSDRHLREIRLHHAPTGDEHVLLCPLLQTAGLLGTIRFGSSWRFLPELRRDLVTLANHVSIRLAELGVTSEETAAPRLTARQREIAELASRGLTNIEISQLLDVSENTVKKHLKDVFARLDVENRTQLAHLLVPRDPLGDVPDGISRLRGVTITRFHRASVTS